jgi:hypothetical protein
MPVKTHARGTVRSAHALRRPRATVRVAGAKVVKMMVWEEAYIERIGNARQDELMHQRRFRSLQVTSTALGRGSPMIAAALTFVVYSRFHPLTPEVVFPALQVFQSLRLPFILLPFIFNCFIGSASRALDPSTSGHPSARVGSHGV